MRGGLFNSPELKRFAADKARKRQIAREKRWREL